MLVNSQEKYAELDKVIAANKGQGGAVMRTLQAAQDIFGHVPMDVQIKIAEGLDSTLAEVYGVATFYSQFALEPAGARPVMNAFIDEIGKRNMLNVVVAQTGCIGMCRYEPIVEVTLPGQEKVTYVHVKPEMVARIVSEHVVNGNPVVEYTIGAAEK